MCGVQAGTNFAKGNVSLFSHQFNREERGIRIVRNVGAYRSARVPTESSFDIAMASEH